MAFGSSGAGEQSLQVETPASIQVTFTWEFDQTQEAAIQGFRIFLNAASLCETSTPSDREIRCETDPLTETTTFTIKSVALNGEESTTFGKDYRGRKILGSYRSSEINSIFNKSWCIAAEIDRAEVNAPAIAFREQILMIGLM